MRSAFLFLVLTASLLALGGCKRPGGRIHEFFRSHKTSLADFEETEFRALAAKLLATRSARNESILFISSTMPLDDPAVMKWFSERGSTSIRVTERCVNTEFMEGKYGVSVVFSADPEALKSEVDVVRNFAKSEGIPWVDEIMVNEKLTAYMLEF